MLQHQVRALSLAHAQGCGEPGKNGKPAGFGNYTFTQLRRKATILKAAGFTRLERRQLIKSGIVGVGCCIGSNKLASGMYENTFVDRQHITPGGPQHDVYSYSHTPKPAPVIEFDPVVVTAGQHREPVRPPIVKRHFDRDPVGGTLTPARSWIRDVDLSAGSSTGMASVARTQSVGGLGAGTSRTAGAGVSDGALAFSQWQDRMNRGAMSASYTAPGARAVQPMADTSHPVPQTNMGAGAASSFSTSGARTGVGQSYTGPQANTPSFGNNPLGKTPSLAHGGSTTAMVNQAMQPGQQRLSQMMASSKLGVKPRLTIKPITGTARPGQLQLTANMDEKAKQQLIKQLLQKAKAKNSRETARAIVLPAVVDGHPRGEFQPMTKNGVLAGWVRKEKGRYAYYDVHGNRTYGFKKPTFTKMGKETGAGEVTLPSGTTKVVAARRWLPILVGGEPKSKLQPVWKDGEVAGWKHDVSGVTKYYDLSGRRTGQDEITIAGTMPPWEYAGLAAGGVRVTANGAAKGVGALLGGAKSVGKTLKSAWKALAGDGAKKFAKEAGGLLDDGVKPVVEFGGRASRSGGKATWEELGGVRNSRKDVDELLARTSNPRNGALRLRTGVRAGARGGGGAGRVADEKPVIKFGGRSSQSGGEIEGSTWDKIKIKSPRTSVKDTEAAKSAAASKRPPRTTSSGPSPGHATALPFSRPRSFPSYRRVKIDMDEVLSGHTVGGARYQSSLLSGRPKDAFPEKWSREAIERAIRNAYRKADRLLGRKVYTKGPDVGHEILTLEGKVGRGTIQFHYNKTTKTIESAWPKGIQ
jgi:hypothetical protein